MKKKILLVLLSWLLIFSMGITSINAYENPNSIQFDDSYTLIDALNDYEDKTLQLGEGTITREDIEVGIAAEQKLNKARMGGYTWQMTGMSTYRSKGALKGYYVKKVTAGVSQSTSQNTTFSIGGKIHGITLSAAFAFSVSMTFNGPSGTESVGSKKATHRLFSAIGYGKIMKYDFVYKDNYTGKIDGYKTEYHITDQSAVGYSNLAYINASNQSLLVKSCSSNSTKSFTNETAYKNKVNSTSPVQYIDF